MAVGADSGPISDAGIAAILRPFVRATRPILDGLRESDPFGLRKRVPVERAGGTLDERGLNAT